MNFDYFIYSIALLINSLDPHFTNLAVFYPKLINQ